MSTTRVITCRFHAKFTRFNGDSTNFSPAEFQYFEVDIFRDADITADELWRSFLRPPDEQRLLIIGTGELAQSVGQMIGEYSWTGLTLDMDSETVRSLGYRIVDIIASEMSDPSKRLPRPPTQSDDILAMFAGPLPHNGTDPDELLSVIEDHFIPATTNLLHPRWMAYVLAGSLPLAGLMGALISSLNLAYVDPVNTRLAKTITRWLGEMLGFGHDAAGYITTGGTWANLVGLAVARVRRAGWDVRAEGLADHPKLTAYVSEEGHTCLDKAMELLGIGSNQLRKIPVTADYRILVDALEEAIGADRAAGWQPFCLIGNAGTVNTGAVDPLDDLAKIAASHRLYTEWTLLCLRLGFRRQSFRWRKPSKLSFAAKVLDSIHCPRKESWTAARPSMVKQSQ